MRLKYKGVNFIVTMLCAETNQRSRHWKWFEIHLIALKAFLLFVYFSVILRNNWCPRCFSSNDNKKLKGNYSC